MNNMKRRKFLKSSVLSGIGTTILSSGHPETSYAEPAQTKRPFASPEKKKRIIVAGAGIAGLCCAYELMKMGHDVTVLEAAKRHGGHVFTVRDGLSDGLYADGGAEQITKPGYERYWEYTREFHLEVLPYPRRNDMVRMIGGKFYTDKQLKEPGVLAQFGLNQREIDYLKDHTWWDLASLFYEPYLAKFKDEYQPFGIGLDEFDQIPVSEIYRREGASTAALKYLGGENASALLGLWRAGILKYRGLNLTPPDVFRLQGGNQRLPDAFAKQLGDRVKLNSPIIAIQNGDREVTVRYRQLNEEKEIKADYLVNCIPLPTFKKIIVTPSLSSEKQFVLDNIIYGSYCHFIFQASSKFWLEDGLPSINLELEHPDINSIWQTADEVDTHRIVLIATGPGGVSAERALAAFRSVYPGKKDTIEQALVKDWTKDQFAPNCERGGFPIGSLKKFWPQVMLPEGRIHFAGSYADNLHWGQEAAIRSADRVAKQIHEL